jgi:hypothetical protein
LRHEIIIIIIILLLLQQILKNIGKLIQQLYSVNKL